MLPSGLLGEQNGEVANGSFKNYRSCQIFVEFQGSCSLNFQRLCACVSKLSLE